MRIIEAASLVLKVGILVELGTSLDAQRDTIDALEHMLDTSLLAVMATWAAGRLESYYRHSFAGILRGATHLIGQQRSDSVIPTLVTFYFSDPEADHESS